MRKFFSIINPMVSDNFVVDYFKVVSCTNERYVHTITDYEMNKNLYCCQLQLMTGLKVYCLKNINRELFFK